MGATKEEQRSPRRTIGEGVRGATTRVCPDQWSGPGQGPVNDGIDIPAGVVSPAPPVRPGAPTERPPRRLEESDDRGMWSSSGSSPDLPKENTTDRRLRFVSDWC